ncbi:MAG TPA: beta-propeller domain-containing protein [Usitatibacter sp.]|nr:beta-propeller domain-containing protein [Usitatibacter sp.]
MTIFSRVAAALLLAALAVPGFAATVADRSPFAQGHWWNPDRAGNGFEIFSAAGQVAVVWYTYDASGAPTWYTAQGDQASLGTQAWTLMKHTWANGRIASSTPVGSFNLKVNHPESLDATWQIGSNQGKWTLQPLPTSGIVLEVDHSGSWFAPANSGWGFGITEAGDVLGGALFTYDASGQPTWFAGFEHTSGGRVDLFSTVGSCPWCAYSPTQATSVGSVTFDFHSETTATLHSGVTASMERSIAFDNAALATLSRPASTRTADRELAAFGTDTALKAYLDSGMSNVQLPSGGNGVDFSPAPPGATTAVSTTNLQESGVDEADTVKSDGTYIYTFATDSQAAVTVAEVSGNGAALAIRGHSPLAGSASPIYNGSGFYLLPDALVAVTQSPGSNSPGLAMQFAGVTRIQVLSPATASAMPSSRWVAEIGGQLLSSRRIGDRLYVVTQSSPFLPGYTFYAGAGTPADAANQQLLAATPLSAMLPKVAINAGAAVPLVDASNVYSPPQGARAPSALLTVVTAIDLGASPRIAQSIAVVGSSDTLYSSPANLYIATSRYASPAAIPGPIQEPGYYLTDVHQLALGAGSMSVVGSATLEGYFGFDPDKAPFRLSESDGRLRAVTSSLSMWGGQVANHLTILEPSSVQPGLLKTVSVLPNAQRPDPLGKPGEQLYATRFVGDRLYAVTFMNIDPLYVVDLSNAADPRIAGQIQIAGFSSYLHPLPNNLMLGFGKYAVPASTLGDGGFSWYQGLQLSLFDVGDPSQPRLLQTLLMGKRGSESALLYDHHALSALLGADGTDLFAMPVSLHDGAPLYGASPSDPTAYYPWLESGLMMFRLQGSTALDTKLVPLSPLITHSVSEPMTSVTDGGAFMGRSVLFPNGVVYVSNGYFWRQDATGAKFGPM